MKLNRLKFLPAYRCACVLEQELEVPERLTGEGFFSCWRLWMDQPVHSEERERMALIVQRNKWWSFGWQHSKRWSKLKRMSNTRVLMVHLAVLDNSSENSSIYFGELSVGPPETSCTLWLYLIEPCSLVC